MRPVTVGGLCLICICATTMVVVSSCLLWWPNFGVDVLCRMMPASVMGLVPISVVESVPNSEMGSAFE
ncbi:MAG: hypothetical protein R3C24_08520 [Cyanobacteriota/Melainabacteria group bacterium]